MINVITAYLHGHAVCTTQTVYQYNSGMRLQFVGVELPQAYEVDFANRVTGSSITQVGGADGVSIPDQFFVPGSTIHAWVVIVGADYAVTRYHIMIPVSPRAVRTNDEPSPSQQSAVDQAIAALNNGVETVEGIAEAIPQTIQDALTEAKESGEFDGPPGKDGKDGQDGKDGTDGYTPIKGVDYFDGQDGAPGKDGKDGQDGQPGRDGEDGEPGQDGISPSITVTDITGGHRVTITDATGPHSFDVMDGTDADAPVQDVQVNGVSVLDAQGVANVPIGSTSNYGVFRLQQYGGLQVGSSGLLKTDGASASIIKAGTDSTRPLVSSRVGDASFYGLAKAAGDTTQSESSNAVGTYTDAAKSAILAMLGISGIIGHAEGATASKAYAVGDAFLHAGALYKAIAAISDNDAIVPGTNCEQTTILDLLKGV